MLLPVFESSVPGILAKRTQWYMTKIREKHYFDELKIYQIQL